MAPRGAARARAPRGSPRLLIGTHNVRGIMGSDDACNALGLSDHWHKLGLDVVLVTETHATEAVAGRAQAMLHTHLTMQDRPMWHYVWGYTDATNSRGVAILVKAPLVGGEFEIIKQYDINALIPQPDASTADADQLAVQQYVLQQASSRIVAVQAKWGGHKIQLASIYMPNTSAEQRDVIKYALHYLHQAAVEDGCTPLWGGDWNFVECERLDRLRQHTPPTHDGAPAPTPTRTPGPPATPGGPATTPRARRRYGEVADAAATTPAQSDAATPATPATDAPYTPYTPSGGRPGQRRRLRSVTKTLHGECPGLVDSYRKLHPNKRIYTFFAPRLETYVGSRIDRFYVGEGMQPWVAACTMPTTDSCGSDHRVLTLALHNRVPLLQGPGLRRCRVSYGKQQDLKSRVDTWLDSALEARPADPAALLDWWPSFKKAFAAQVHAASRAARQRAFDTKREVQQLSKDADAAFEKAARPGQSEAAAAASIAAYKHAQQALKQAQRAATQAATIQVRQKWVHHREVTHDAFAAIFRKPQSSRCIEALKDPHSGRMLTDPSQLPPVMIDVWSKVSRKPETKPDSMAKVLSALEQDTAVHLNPTTAAAAGTSTVSAKEVQAALKHMATGRSPGKDGIPVEAYRTHGDRLEPVLAALYTAIHQLGAVPEDFLLGAITFLYKKGAKSDPANYRPITLLNSDYRILARILASRLGPAMGAVIDKAQCAFLPSRRIGEAIHLLQLLPELLKRQGKEAVIAFLDFSKAYDTVSRDFLFAAMEKMQAGEGMLKWVKLLLTDTKAVAVVNGHVSKPATFHAGVRQGCPLSPLLYLFVAQALLTWLKSHDELGININPYVKLRAAAGQYADDASAFMNSLITVVNVFTPAMVTFKEATGQGMNIDKTFIMRIGRLSNEPTPEGFPYPIITSTESLGIRLSNDPATKEEMTEYWQRKLSPTYKCLDRLAKCHLSAMGRGFGASGYALSAMLYHAEYMGLPTGRPGIKVLNYAAAVVDRNGERLTGVARRLLTGSPKAGGFGLMDVERHIAARHAWWSLALLHAPKDSWPPKPWVAVARELISAFQPDATPFAMLAHCADVKPHNIFSNIHKYFDAASYAIPNPPARSDMQRAAPIGYRLLTGLRAYTHRLFCMAASPRLGEWIRHAPLRSNPMLRLTRSPHVGNGTPPVPATEREALEAQAAPLECHSQTLARYFAAQHGNALVPRTVQEAVTWRDERGGANHAIPLNQILSTIPVQWQRHCSGAAATTIIMGAGGHTTHHPAAATAAGGNQAAQSAHAWGDDSMPATTPERWDAEGRIVQHMRLSLLQSNTLVPLDKVRVKQLTDLAYRLSATCNERRIAIREYVTAAGYAAGAQETAQATKYLCDTSFKAIWKLPMENSSKEIFLRLAVDGVRMYGAARYTKGQPLACYCQQGQVSRMHHYWDCPAAQVVIQQVQAGLEEVAQATAAAGEAAADTAAAATASPPTLPVTRQHIWLLEPPTGVHADLWRVVALAALTGMDTGRRALVKAYLIAKEAAKTQPAAADTTTAPEPLATAEVQRCVALAQTAAINRFWAIIQDFATLNRGRPPKSWLKSIADAGEQPFFRLTQQQVLELPSSQQHQQHDNRHRQRPAGASQHGPMQQHVDMEWRIACKPRPVILPDTIT